MKKISFLILLCSLLLGGCSQNNVEKSPIIFKSVNEESKNNDHYLTKDIKNLDIYQLPQVQNFTDQFNESLYNNGKNQFNDRQLESFKKIEEAIRFYLKQDLTNAHKNMKIYLLSHDFNIPDQLYEYPNLNSNLNDGSNIEVNFYPKKEYIITIKNLNERQCKYLLDFYTKNKDFIFESVYEKNLSCDEKSLYTGFTIVPTHKKTKNYEKNIVYSKIDSILNKNYFNLKEDDNIYLTKTIPDHVLFLKGANYIISKEQPNTVFIGAINENSCKNLIYYAPENLSIEVFEQKQCQKNDYNILKIKLK